MATSTQAVWDRWELLGSPMFATLAPVIERLPEDHFPTLAELNRLGANLRKENATAIIVGVDSLSGAQVTATDLRASAALVLAGLVASGSTTILQVSHIDRGYERIEKRLEPLGAKIVRIYYDERPRLPKSLGAGGE